MSVLLLPRVRQRIVATSFSDFKDPGKLFTWEGRRAAHSARDKLTSTFGNSVGEVAEKTALAGATVNAACTVAVAAGAAGAFVAVASGPIAAGALGVVGLMLAAKSSYSNRESAHNKLMPYVWSYIDDVQPEPITEANSKKIGAAALSLISDGQPQQKLMNAKFRNREFDFNRFARKYEEVSVKHEMFLKGGPPIKKEYKDAVCTWEDRRMQLLHKAYDQNGAVFEYMRRLGHMANYMQAPVVFGMIMQRQMSPLPDFAKNVPAVSQARASLKTFQERIRRHDKAYLEATRLQA